MDTKQITKKAELKVRMFDIARKFTELKGNTDYPLSVFVELLHLETDVLKLLKDCAAELGLDEIHVDIRK